jgi:hypothetical protein
MDWPEAIVICVVSICCTLLLGMWMASTRKAKFEEEVKPPSIIYPK